MANCRTFKIAEKDYWTPGWSNISDHARYIKQLDPFIGAITIDQIHIGIMQSFIDSRMCLFKVNTGTREQEFCQLRWQWEILIPELNTSVFLIPAEFVKNREDRIVVLNHTALSVINSVRGVHPEFVFTYKSKPITSINNTSWKRIRRLVDLENVRVHDLKHTFGRRLRSANVSLETRKVLLGHTNNDITSHYSAPELNELIEAANRVCETKSGKTPALTLIKNLRAAV